MKRIVCATRGGAASRRVQEEAIALAKESGADLVFLYVADSAACRGMPQELAPVVADELTRLGRSLLHIAHVRARERGIEAGMVARCGQVRQTIVDFVVETGADALIIGAPHAKSATPQFGDEGIRAFAREVAEATGAQVVIV
jgi:nucleotide-binding universal stress UspA family protein